jgi:hypothetical protein
MDVYQAFNTRFIDGRPWQGTDYYASLVQEIDNGTETWRCTTKADLDQRLEELDRFFEQSKKNGNKSQPIRGNGNDPLFPGEEEITLRIDRNGRFQVERGNCYLALAKLLEIPRVPAKISMRHMLWCNLLREVAAYAEHHGGKIYHPATHPDLRRFPSEHGHYRFENIIEHLPCELGQVLDIGAHWGYFCHRFEEMGFDCVAVENDQKNVYFLEKLKVAEGRQFEVISKSIFDYREKVDFDVVLALNVFHHFLKSEPLYTRLVEFLQRLNTQSLFLQTHLPDDHQMEGAFKNHRPEEFVGFVQRHTRLGTARYIGKGEDGRPIYILQRS